MQTRPVIEQAKGILTAYGRTTPDSAFDDLVRASQNHNVRLVEIAEALVHLAAGHEALVDQRMHELIGSEWKDLAPGASVEG